MRAKLRTFRIGLVATMALLLCACGVSFSEDFEGTELIKAVFLTGERVPGAQLTVNLQVTNGYPVPVRIACYYEDPNAVTEEQENLAFSERAHFVGEAVLPAQEGRTPAMFGGEAGKTAPRETLIFTFPAPPPGRYFLACLTPAAADNGLGVNFRIESP